MKDLVDQTLGHYRIEAVLGFGGMGQVFRGKHVYLDRLAAVKVMHAHLASHPTFRARFLQEAKSTAALKDPHIVEIYEFGEQDGLLYLVMELLTDGTLKTFLQQGASEQRSVPPLLVGLDLIRQAAEGLAAAHALGIIHRDIKPDNLLLTRVSGSARGGEQYQLKISDFGLARLSESSGLTAGGPIGTPAYMSPEQCQSQVLDSRSDLYSLGIVLYEVVTGRLPFQINSFSDALQKHVNAVPPSPQEVRPDLPPIVEQIIMRCLAKRPEERYQTARELANELQRSINHATLETRAPLVAPVANPTKPLQAPVHPPLQVRADSITNRTTYEQTQGIVSTKKRWIPTWFFPVLTALLAVALVLDIVIPRQALGVGPTPLPNFDPTQFYNAATSGSPFYSSDLRQQDKAQWDQGSQFCGFANGGYEVKATPGINYGLAVCLEKALPSFSDFAFQVQMTIHSGDNTFDGGGPVFRGTSTVDDIYRWRIGLDGSYDVRNGNLIGPANSVMAFPVLNHTILLTVIAQGNLTFLYVEKKFISCAYSTFANHGQIGLFAYAQNQPVDITFTTAQVWKL